MSEDSEQESSEDVLERLSKKHKLEPIQVNIAPSIDVTQLAI